MPFLVGGIVEEIEIIKLTHHFMVNVFSIDSVNDKTLIKRIQRKNGNESIKEAYRLGNKYTFLHYWTNKKMMER